MMQIQRNKIYPALGIIAGVLWLLAELGIAIVYISSQSLSFANYISMELYTPIIRQIFSAFIALGSIGAALIPAIAILFCRKNILSGLAFLAPVLFRLLITEPFNLLSHFSSFLIYPDGIVPVYTALWIGYKATCLVLCMAFYILLALDCFSGGRLPGKYQKFLLPVVTVLFVISFILPVETLLTYLVYYPALGIPAFSFADILSLAFSNLFATIINGINALPYLFVVLAFCIPVKKKIYIPEGDI